jgi:hypothetical protein
MNQAFSEYVLYEPILRILMARGYVIECEYECPGIPQPLTGDKKRLDFFATGHDLELALEIKWAKSNKPLLSRDVEKLEAVLAARPDAIALLCVFGRKSHIETLKLGTDRFRERGKAVFADLGKTKYGCRIFQLRLVQ